MADGYLLLEQGKVYDYRYMKGCNSIEFNRSEEVPSDDSFMGFVHL